LRFTDPKIFSLGEENKKVRDNRGEGGRKRSLVTF